MPFDNSFNDIYKFGIKGAAEEVGAYAERIDEQIFSEGILDRIFNQISKADVIVADMSGRNPNVFYEVGYAHALGKLVLLLTQDADDIPFDLKHRQHTVYGGKIETLRQELAGRLQWAISEARAMRSVRAEERFSLRIHGLQTTAPDSGDPPVLRGKAVAKSFYTTLELRNEGAETAQPITHVYLFSSPSAALVPIRQSTGFTDTYGLVGRTGTAPETCGRACNWPISCMMAEPSPGSETRT
jgi:nucleoside 2-deoxyribosyltransferase